MDKKDSMEKVSKKIVKQENKQLLAFFIGIFIFAVIFISIIFFSQSFSEFKHRNTEYKIIQEGNLIFYNTFFKVYEGNRHVSDYNFYIRNDPRKLTKEVPFEGSYTLLENMIINTDESLACEGDGAIAIANLANVNRFFGVNVTGQDSVCDVSGSYTYLSIIPGEETKVEENSKNCYKITINNCEILKGTERFIVESFDFANGILK